MRWTPLIAAIGLALVVPASALGAGGPVPPVQGGNGIMLPTGAFRYVAVAAGRDTVIKRLPVGGGPAQDAIRLSGRYGIPGVDIDGELTGLSADGHTLVVAEVSRTYPPRTTRLLVLDTPGLAVRRTISLPGWSNVDAISPDARWLYLIHYPAADISRYEVLAYDMVTRHLLAKPIVDPDDADEPMTGFAVTRVMSADSRWAYTLYLRPSGTPFIHALDTVGHRAVCVDLPSSVAPDIGNGQLVLGPGGATIRITINGLTDAVVDTRTFAVTRGPADVTPGPIRAVARTVRPVAHTGSGSGDGASGFPWELVAAAAALAVLGGAVGLRGRLRTG